ncbi:CehA/McbA family metallohydrolase [Saccharibacillus kuerlensis]|uniref:Polymerase/histidinol phosphatase N-terminal domain-containing protein n=1 Tax=Saccharibacillus kuerlensis TaxID=459527 RepID=A0ABQ2L7H5_9BACL|nr:CehA/McbA family metallohydrolase [Saccharibacillus kuerlensis]GGO03429.1 hypothetical protein GCM10010969_27700 [Saccharibacillus kuerlensis]
MTWFACELHTHTLHSDGRQTLGELAAGAAGLGFDVIALTDHNTMSGLVGKEEIEQEHGLTIIPGMEWTTFYGHMVTIGLSEFADWRQAGLDDIDQGIAEVHRLGGIAGLAHPFRIGSPACTGCFWEYKIDDWNAVDYIEVWSGTFPSIQTNNRRAFDLWTDKLNEGYRIAATSGRDWHEQKETDEPISVTYLEIDEETADGKKAGGSRTDSGSKETPAGNGSCAAEKARDTESEKNAADGFAASVSLEDRLIQALREGRASVTIGPLLTMKLNAGGESYRIGSVVPAAGQAEEHSGTTAAANELISVDLLLDFSVRAGLWSLPEQTFKLKLQSNLGEELSLDVPVPVSAEAEESASDHGGHIKTETQNQAQQMRLEAKLPHPTDKLSRKWLRAELWGHMRGVYVRIAFTNAIYFEYEEGATSR